MDTDEIVHLFSYTEREQELFPYIRVNMTKVQRKLPKILENPKQRERFMVAGLYLTYRAYNFMGMSITTEISEQDIDLKLHDILNERLLAFKRLTGKAIGDTSDYLSMIHFGPILLQIIWHILFMVPLWCLRLSDPGTWLYRFVLRGKVLAF
jgi:hypothetical protein